MSDDKSKEDYRDRKRINTEEPYEVSYWAKKFNVTPNKLIDAIEASGTSSVEKIEEYLKKK